MGRLNSLIDSVVTLTSEARQRHFAQWPVLGQYIWPNPEPIPTSYEGEISTLKGWLEDRLTWLDANLPKTGGCVDYPAGEKASFLITSIENPVTNSSKLVIQSKLSQQVTIVIYDIAGRKAAEYYLNLSQGYNNYTIPFHYRAAGIYLLQFVNDTGETFIKKILKL
jgi:hypothetical protein